MVTFKATLALSTVTSLYVRVAVTSTPPALPTTKQPHVSESRLNRISPFSWSVGRSLAPYMPVSSSAVIRPSMGPCFKVLSSITAMIAATPIPLSAPNVVFLALTHSLSIQVSMGSVSKLWLLSGDFCGTMSICACMVTVFLFSMPGEAGLRITTLLPSSIKASTPTSFAKSNKNVFTFSRCPDGRGTHVRL